MTVAKTGKELKMTGHPTRLPTTTRLPTRETLATRTPLRHRTQVMTNTIEQLRSDNMATTPDRF